jgi:hypothetical protein
MSPTLSLPPALRRALVVFLILLFPLNVFALSMSAATLVHPAGTHERVDAAAAQAAGADLDDGFAGDGSGDPGDIDPDEPPAGADLHYIVGHAGGLHVAGLSRAAAALHDAAPRCHAVAPPVKPPRAA